MHQLQENAHAGALIRQISGIAIAISAVAFDIWTKRLWFGHETVLIPGFAAVTSHQNTGLLFDIPFAWWMSAALTTLLLITLCLVACVQAQKQTLRVHIGLWLIIGGGIGNLWDRVTLHFVRDWMLLFGRSAFNVADVCVLIGILLVGRSISHTSRLDKPTE